MTANSAEYMRQYRARKKRERAAAESDVVTNPPDSKPAAWTVEPQTVTDLRVPAYRPTEFNTRPFTPVPKKGKK